jgi:hypothetical protein
MILKRWMMLSMILFASATLTHGQNVAPAPAPLPAPLMGRDPFEEARQRMREMEERMDQLFRERFGEQAFPFDGEPFPRLPRLLPPLRPPIRPSSPSSQEEPRLGARLALPSATLAEQLDLPRDQGLILEELAPSGAAAKAGLRAHDILLELAGQPVPRSLEAFQKQLAAMKSDAPCEVTVMRKGVKQTIKGVQLAQARPAQPRDEVRDEVLPLPRWDFPELRIPAKGGTATNVFRFSQQGEQFSAEMQSDGVTYSLVGKRTADGPVLTQIRVERDGKTQSYSNLAEVPEADRVRVERLLRSIR